MPGKKRVRGKDAPLKGQMSLEEIGVPEGYAAEDWLDMSDVMGDEEPEKVEEVRIRRAREDD